MGLFYRLESAYFFGTRGTLFFLVINNRIEMFRNREKKRREKSILLIRYNNRLKAMNIQHGVCLNLDKSLKEKKNLLEKKETELTELIESDFEETKILAENKKKEITILEDIVHSVVMARVDSILLYFTLLKDFNNYLNGLKGKEKRKMNRYKGLFAKPLTELANPLT